MSLCISQPIEICSRESETMHANWKENIFMQSKDPKAEYWMWQNYLLALQIYERTLLESVKEVSTDLSNSEISW